MGSLFSGIGGLDLGLEWGIKDAETVWQIEQEPFGRSILAKHWPDASREVTDVRKGNAENLARVDLISGGFPCQDISVAGNQKGFDGEKSSLWYEMSRIIGELRPRFIVLENVAAIVAPNMRFVMARVLSDIRAHGYNAEWKIISAAQCGAPHLRRRFFLIGWLPSDADSNRESISAIDAETPVMSKIMANADDSTDAPVRGERPNVPRESDRGRDDRSRSGSGSNAKRKKPVRETRRDPRDDVANAESARRERFQALSVVVSPRFSKPPRSGSDVANADSAQRAGAEAVPSVLPQEQSSTSSSGEPMADAMRQRRQGQGQREHASREKANSERKASHALYGCETNPWALEPPLGRVVNGLSKRLSRRNRHALRALGNAVVPQCGELVGRRVQEIREILDNE
jgi:DNA-cytosine methyltransferase